MDHRLLWVQRGDGCWMLLVVGCSQKFLEVGTNYFCRGECEVEVLPPSQEPFELISELK